MEKLKTALVVAAALLLVVIAGVVFAAFQREDGGWERPYSTHEAQPRGTKAFYLLLEESGLPAYRWNLPLTRLRAGENKQVLLMIEPDRRPVFYPEVEALRQWVEEGNRLVLLGLEQSAVLEAFGLELESRHYFAQARVVNSTGGHPLLEGAATLSFNRGGTFSAASGGTPLVANGANTYVLWKRAGSGEIVVIADPEIATNRSIAAADNLRLLLNAAGAFEGPLAVFIDEYHHGFGMERPVVTAAAGNRVLSYLTWPAVQLVLAIVLTMVTLGTRFAAPRPLPEPSGRSLEAAVASAAAIYRRAGAKRLVFRILYAAFKRRLARKYRLPPDLRPGSIAMLGEAAAGLDRRELESDFGRFEAALSSADFSARELFALSRRIDHYRRRFSL